MAFGTELLFILFFSIMGGVLAARFKQPTVLGVLLAGALIGPNALGLLHDAELLEITIEIGAILLLFLVGLEFSLRKLFDLGVRAIIVSAIKLGILFFVSYHVALLFGLDVLSAMFFGVILSITSTVIFLKILEQKGLFDSPETSLLVAVLIIEDIFGVFSLTFFSQLSQKAMLTLPVVLSKLIISIVVLGVVYIILRKVLNPVVEWLSNYSTEDTIIFISIGICAAMAYFAFLIGLSTAVGAFLAGNIVASLKNAKIFEKAAHPFILTFTSLFFLAIGTQVNFLTIFSNFYLILALLAVMVVFSFLAIAFSVYMFSDTTGKGAVFSGLAMIPLGEFSLLLAKEAQKTNPGVDFVSITAIIIFLSTLIMSMVISHSERTYNLVKKMLPSGFVYDIRIASKYMRSISARNILSSFRARKIGFEWKTLYRNAIGIFIVLFIVAAWYNITGFGFIIQLFQNEKIPWVILGISLLIIIFPTFNLVRSLRNIMVQLFKSFISLYPKEIANESKIFRNFVFIILLFFAAILIPFIVSFLDVNKIWSSISLVLMIFILFALTRTESYMEAVVKKNKDLLQNYIKKNRERFNNLRRQN